MSGRSNDATEDADAAQVGTEISTLKEGTNEEAEDEARTEFKKKNYGIVKNVYGEAVAWPCMAWACVCA